MTNQRSRRLILTVRNLTDQVLLTTPTETILITARILNSRIRIGIEAPDSVVVKRSTMKKEESDE